MRQNYDAGRYRDKDNLRARLIAYRAAGGISHGELLTAIVLLDIRNVQKGDCWAHNQTIADTVGVSPRTAHRYVDTLAETGLFAIMPPRRDRNCCTFDFDMDWMPTSIEPALAPVAARVADYDGRFPGRGTRMVAKALGIGHMSVARARHAACTIGEVDANAWYSNDGTEVPIEVTEHLSLGTVIPEVYHPLYHRPVPSIGKSETMVHPQPTASTTGSASNRSATLADPSAKKQERSATTVAEQEPLEPFSRSESGGALRAPPPASSACSRAPEKEKKEDLATKFEQLLDIWQNPNGTKPIESRKAFLAAVKRGGDPDAILTMAKKHVVMMSAGEPRYFKRLDRWLDEGLWRHEPVDRSRRARRGSGKKASNGDGTTSSHPGAAAAPVAGGMTDQARQEVVGNFLGEHEAQSLAFEQRQRYGLDTERNLSAAVDALKAYRADVLKPLLALEGSLPPPNDLQSDPVHRWAVNLSEYADTFADRIATARAKLGTTKTPERLNI
jgi:hypothetical protein